MSILVIIPTRPDCPAEVAYRSFQAEQAMREKCLHVDIVRDFDWSGGYTGMKERHLGDQHSHIMWMPDNLVVYDPLLPGKLVQRKADAVVLPQVKPQGVKGDAGDKLVKLLVWREGLDCALAPSGYEGTTVVMDMSTTVWTHNPEFVDKVPTK